MSSEKYPPNVPLDYGNRNIADLNIKLMNACSRKDIKSIKELIEKGADVNCVIGIQTPLSISVDKYDVEAVRLLLEHGALDKKSSILNEVTQIIEISERYLEGKPSKSEYFTKLSKDLEKLKAIEDSLKKSKEATDQVGQLPSLFKGLDINMNKVTERSSSENNCCISSERKLRRASKIAASREHFNSCYPEIISLIEQGRSKSECTQSTSEIKPVLPSSQKLMRSVTQESQSFDVSGFVNRVNTERTTQTKLREAQRFTFSQSDRAASSDGKLSYSGKVFAESKSENITPNSR